MEIQDNYIRDVYQVIDIHDGDTFTVLVDNGFDDFRKVKIRLKGINTAEMNNKSKGLRMELAKKAKEYVTNILKNRKIRIHSEEFEDGGFGRYLATVYYQNEQGEWINLNQELLDKGLAQHYYLGASKDYGAWKE